MEKNTRYGDGSNTYQQITRGTAIAVGHTSQGLTIHVLSTNFVIKRLNI